MESIQAGQLLVAVPGMFDPNFDATVVYLLDTEDGTAGLVLNRPTDIAVADVMPLLSGPVAEPAVVFQGGPVALEQGVILGAIGSTVTVIDAETAAEAGPGTIRVFAGYAGWETEQLENEISSGGWFVLAGTADDVLTPEPLGLWREVFARQPGEIHRYRHYPDNPRFN